MRECKTGNVEYLPGETYIKGNCNQNCTCTEVPNIGHKEQCTQLCSFSNITCSNNTRLEFYQENIPGSNCKCKRPRCVEGMLIHLVLPNNLILIITIPIMVHYH